MMPPHQVAPSPIPLTPIQNPFYYQPTNITPLSAFNQTHQQPPPPHFHHSAGYQAPPTHYQHQYGQQPPPNNNDEEEKKGKNCSLM
jgi:hypothetical protein